MAHKIATKEDALDDDDDDDDARLSLPIRRYQKEIVRAVRENAVVVILGETGSGKTTQIAQMLYENMEELLVVDKEGNGETKRRRRENGIAVTQPRRVAAISVARL